MSAHTQDLGAATVRELADAVEAGHLALEDARAELAQRGPNLEPRNRATATDGGAPESAQGRRS